MDYLDSGFDDNLMRAGELVGEPQVQFDMANIGELFGDGALPLASISALAGAVDGNGNWINELISATLNSQSKQILAEYTFGASGALAIITDANNGLWISPTGILGKKAGVNTFALDNAGNATFGGTLVAASGTLGALTVGTNAWHVDASGNMWWGSSSTFAGATISISAAGVVAFTSGTFRGTLNADDITAGTLTGRTVKASGGAGTDVWIDSSTGQLLFRYGSATKGFMYVNSSGQMLIDSDSLAIMQADGAGDDVALSAGDDVLIDAGGTIFLVGDMFFDGAITTSSTIISTGNIRAGGTFESSDGSDGETTGDDFVTSIYLDGDILKYKYKNFSWKDGILTSHSASESTGTVGDVI